MKEHLAALYRAVYPLFMGALVVLLVSGCGLEAPQSPTWDTTLTIPLINRSYSSEELLAKLASDNIETDDQGNSLFRIQKDLDTVTLQSLLEIDPINSEFEKSVGRIQVLSPENQNQSLAFSDYVPLIAGQVPEIGVSASLAVAQASSFSQAEIDEGSIAITAINNTGFDLDSLTCLLVESGAGQTVALYVSPGGLSNGEQHSTQFSLNGMTIRSEYELQVYFHTLGGPALSLNDRKIDFVISYSDEIYATSLSGMFESFTREYTQQISIGDETHVITAELANGMLNLGIQNTLPTDVDLELEFPGISRDGTALVINQHFYGGQVQNQSVDLSGWTVEPNNDSLLTLIDAFVYGRTDSFVEVDAQDNFLISIDGDNLSVANGTAVVSPTELEITLSEVAVDIPTGFENISLDYVELNISVANSTELPGQVEIDLQASNGKSLQLSGPISAGTSNSASINQIYSDQLADLLNPLPEYIEVSGIVRVGDGVTIVDLSEQDFILADAVITSPMAFKITAATIEGDKNELEIGDDISDAADRLNHGTFTSRIENHLPLGAQLSLYIGADQETLFDSPLTVIGPISFGQAAVDANGIVTQELVTSSEVVLDSDDLQVFENRNLFIAPVLEIAGSEGQTVRIRAADYLSINGILEIEARIGGEE